MAAFNQIKIRLLHLKKDLPNKKEKGYPGFGKSEAVVSRYIGVLEDFANLTEKYLCWSLFFNEVVGLKLYYKRFQHRCFPVKFVKFLRVPFFTEQLAVSGKSIQTV